MTTETFSTTLAIAGHDARHSIENPSVPLDVHEHDSDPQAPLRVTQSTAVTLAAVWQAVNVLSADVAQLPIKVYKRLDDGGKEYDRGHANWRLLHRRPHRHLGPFQFKQLMMYRALLWGNAYAYIVRNNGVATELRPLDPGTVEVELVMGEIVYRWVDEKGTKKTLDRSDIFHIRGAGGDLLCGQSVVSLARSSLSVGLSAQRYGEHYFNNNATPRIAIEVGERVNQDQAKNMLRYWETRHSGPANAGKPGLLESGSKIHTFGMSNEDAQFLETREFSRSEVASWFNLPPHKVGDLTRATFSNIEQQSIDYVTSSLRPWLIRWQDECNDKLFTEEEIAADSHVAEFVVNALLQGDFKSRNDGYTQAINAGWLTRNEVRGLENYNRIDSLDEPLVPLNMSTAKEAEEGELEGEEDDDVRQLFIDASTEAVAKSYQRCVTHASKAAKTPGDLSAWIAANESAEVEAIRGMLANSIERSSIRGYIDASVTEVAGDVWRAVVLSLNEEMESEKPRLKARINARAAKCPIKTETYFKKA